MRAIDADALTEIIHGMYAEGDDQSTYHVDAEGDTLIGKFAVVDAIFNMPTIQPRREEQKIGEWIYDWGDWDFETCKCSECGNHMTTPIGERYSFCPNCGARMEVDNEQDD